MSVPLIFTFIVTEVRLIMRSGSVRR